MPNHDEPTSQPPADEPVTHTDSQTPYASTAIPDDEYQLPIQGFKGTPEEIERQWYEQCYRGRGDSMWQLTWRAILMGSVLGGILSLTNLYIGLKSGWGFGVAITACILSYSIWTTFHKIGLVGTKMTVLENNCMQSTASSAGYSTGGTLVSAIAAYILVNNDTIPIFTLMAWVFFLAILGVTMAIPMKRQMINIEQLRFPSGIAAAETLKALHTTGGRGIASAKALGIAGVLSAISAFWTMGLHVISDTLARFELSRFAEWISAKLFGKYWTGHTVAISWEPMFIAAGAITGIRVCTSMLIGGILCWCVLTPWALENDVIPLSIEEPLPQLPAEVAFLSSEMPKEEATAALTEIDPGLRKHLEYVAYARKLEWKGEMSAEKLDMLLGLSNDSDYELAIHRLFIRSQYRAAAPLDTLPAGVTIPPELQDVVSFDAEQGLIAESLITPGQYETLHELSPSPTYRDAVAELYARSRLVSFEPLWSAAPLAELPAELDWPEDLGPYIHHDEAAGQLFWRGTMTTTERDALLAAHDNGDYAAAIDTLYQESQNLTLAMTLPDVAAGIVEFDAARGGLRAYGALPDDVKTAIEELAAGNPGTQRTVARLADASTAERASANFRDLVKWSLWGGAACMVTSALFAFAFQWRSVVQALASLGAIFSRRKPGELEGHKQIETPTSWFLGGQLVGGIGVVVLAYYVFAMPLWLSILAIVLSFFLAIVACRVCGETDTTPVGAMGKVTQLMYGVITPGQLVSRVKMNINLMAACITAGAADSSSDLLIDLKSGYMLGANPRKQFIAQFAGIFTGTLASVVGFTLVVPNADALGTAQFPAPAAQAWAAVAKLLSDGLAALHSTAVWAIIIGGGVGILLPLLEKTLPKYNKWVPSAAGLGLAFTFPWYYSLLFFVGAVIGLVIEKRSPKTAEDFTFPVASGVIAGEALMGVALIFIENGPQMFEQLVAQFGGA